jgi:hypothetical protein
MADGPLKTFAAPMSRLPEKLAAKFDSRRHKGAALVETGILRLVVHFGGLFLTERHTMACETANPVSR